MKIPQEVIDDIKKSPLRVRELRIKHGLSRHYVWAVKRGKLRFNEPKEIYSVAFQDKPYPFGKYPKTKYEAFKGVALVYSFVTTIHSEDYCVDVLLDRLLLNSTAGKMRMFKTVNGIKTLIGNDSRK
jgi:hypothetical protein